MLHLSVTCLLQNHFLCLNVYLSQNLLVHLFKTYVASVVCRERERGREIVLVHVCMCVCV